MEIEMQSHKVGLHVSSIYASTQFSLHSPNACQIRIVLLVMYQVENPSSTRRARKISKDSMVSERVSGVRVRVKPSQGKIVHKLEAWKFIRNTTFYRRSNGILVTNCSAINLHKLLISLKNRTVATEISSQSAYSMQAQAFCIILLYRRFLSYLFIFLEKYASLLRPRKQLA